MNPIVHKALSAVATAVIAALGILAFTNSPHIFVMGGLAAAALVLHKVGIDAAVEVIPPSIALGADKLQAIVMTAVKAEMGKLLPAMKPTTVIETPLAVVTDAPAVTK